MQHPAAFPELAPEVVDEVLTADASAQPVATPRWCIVISSPLAASCPERRRETRVAVGDLEVSDDRVRN